MQGPSREESASASQFPPPSATSDDASTTFELQPGTYVGRYLVIGLIGKGGMGSVYRAYDPQLSRNVALKLIHFRSSFVGDELRQRLLREAQALAQVVHSHVVSVFDVGEFHDEVFFAMELIEGSTLREEMRRSALDRRSLLRWLDQAGRGLVAAHQAGLVHRDFKPENVLVDHARQAKVVDFGLARAVDARKAEDWVTASTESHTSLVDRRITETSALMGTPAYMAPEQFLGICTDARSDQFSFAIVAYEALFGRHPFADKGGKISMVALVAGQIGVSGQRLDPGYLRVLNRGLSRDPSKRYPSLEDLLDDLAHVPARRRRRRGAIAAVACAAVGLVGGPVIQKYRAQRCDTAAAQALVGIWDRPRREKVESAFVGDGKAFGRDVWNRVSAVLDGYANQWQHTSTEICRSTEWWRADDNAMHKRSSSCLDERRRELRAVTDVLAGGDRDVRLRAPDVLIQLDALSTCTNAAALERIPLPIDDRAASTAVERIRDLLAQSRALNDAGKVAPSEEAARQALGLARERRDRALAAEALYRLSVAQETGAEYDASEASVVQAIADAEASGHERLLPYIWTHLLSVVGWDEEHPNEVERLIPIVESTVERFDPQGPSHIQFLTIRGLFEHGRGRYDNAIGYFNAALDESRRAFGENDVRRVEIYRHIADSERNVNRLDNGIAHMHSALAETEALFGHEHPQLMKTLPPLARMLSEQGDGERAQAMVERALRIVEQASSPGSADVALSMFQIGMAHLEDGHPALALPLFRRAYAIVPVNSTEAGAALSGMARAEEALGHLETARASFEEALARRRQGGGPGHPQTILVGVRLGRLLRALHRERDALQLCTQLLDAGERAPGPHGVYVALALSCVGEGYEALGRLPEALAALQRAERLLEDEATPPKPEFRAIVGFALARVLWETGGERERARRLANEAVVSYQHAGRIHSRDVIAVQAWLTKISAQPSPP